MIGSGVDGALRGRGLDEIARDGALRFGLAAGQYNVGEAGQALGLSEGSSGKALMHGAVGAGYSHIIGGSAVTGFAAGAATELASPYLSSTSEDGASPVSSWARTRDPANTDLKSAAALVGGVAAFAAGGSAEDISTAGMVSSSAVQYNRELHPKELMVLRKAQEGKSEEERERLEMAAHARVHSSSGVPGDDAEKPQLLAKDAKGALFRRESAILDDTARKLGVSGAFEYTEMHSIDDALSSGYDHILTRGGGALSLISGSVGVVSMGGLAAASSLSATAGNPHSIPGAVFAGGLASMSYTHAVRGSDRLFGRYESDLGARVERSFLEPVGSSYAGRILERAATEAGVALGSIAAFRALPAIDGAVSGAVSRGGGVGVTSRASGGADYRVKWIDERASMHDRARYYNDSAHGARSNTLTKNTQAPSLEFIGEAGVRQTVRFDGLEGKTLIDRKLSVVTTEKAKSQALRQSEALKQNGLNARWEVPDESQRSRALKMFKELNINNIGVEVVKEPKF